VHLEKVLIAAAECAARLDLRDLDVILDQPDIEEIADVDVEQVSNLSRDDYSP
jgi:hypothetical protein